MIRSYIRVLSAGLMNVEIRVEPGKDGWRTRYFVLCNYDEGGCGAAGGERHSIDEAVWCWNERKVHVAVVRKNRTVEGTGDIS